MQKKVRYQSTIIGISVAPPDLGECPDLDFSPRPSPGLSCQCYNKPGGSILNGHYWSQIAFPLTPFGASDLGEACLNLSKLSKAWYENQGFRNQQSMISLFHLLILSGIHSSRILSLYRLTMVGYFDLC
jgi:hypothetical protein